MKRIFLAAVFVAAASGASMAQSTKVTCHLKASNSEWLPRVVELTLTGDKIVVTDEVINGFKFLRPIKAEIAVDNARRRTYKWLLRDVTGYRLDVGTREHWDVSYRLTVQKTSHEVLLIASPLGVRGAGTGRQTVGTCDGV